MLSSSRGRQVADPSAYCYQPKALLFDLGGVVVDVDFDRALAAWAPHSSLSLPDLRRAFKFDLQYQRHERGEISSSEYFDHLATILELSASRTVVAEGWNAVFVGEVAQTRAMVQAMRAHLPCYAFTNTNASHMPVWSALLPEVVASFDRIFASHEIGMRKPERAAFERICRAVGVEARSIMFFDDLLENVQAARAAGLQAVHVRTSEDVRRALQDVGYAL